MNLHFHLEHKLSLARKTLLKKDYNAKIYSMTLEKVFYYVQKQNVMIIRKKLFVDPTVFFQPLLNLP